MLLPKRDLSGLLYVRVIAFIENFFITSLLKIETLINAAPAVMKTKREHFRDDIDLSNQRKNKKEECLLSII